MSNTNLTRLTKKNLLYVIKTSVGVDMFKHIFVKDDSEYEFDAIDGGENSCAYHVSGVLALVGLIDMPHATVNTTLKKIIESGWYEAKNPVAGSIIYWPIYDGHDHIGFYIDDNTAISNSSTEKRPVQHSLIMPDGRQPQKYYSHPSLGND